MDNTSTSNPVFQRPPEIELLRAEARGTLTPKQLQREAEKRQALRDLEANQVTGDEAFLIKKADDWLCLPPDYDANDSLFGNLWYKNELCILFADTNSGKSILAVQIGDAISRGQAIGGMAVQQQPEPVLYFDFELTATQFAKRYTTPGGQPHRFAPNFYRVVINPDATRERKFASYHHYLINSLENIILSTGSRTIIIDNITCLRSGTENAAAAIKLMHSLHHIKNRYQVSLLVLAHTPKRNPARPISRNDLQGSKMLMNFADSAFAIGESQASPGLRYLKQVKQRSNVPVYNAGTVQFCRIIKTGSFLQFEFEGDGPEHPHLLPYTTQHRKTTEDQIFHLHTSGKSVRSIAHETGHSHTTVQRIITKMKEGQERAQQVAND